VQAHAANDRSLQCQTPSEHDCNIHRYQLLKPWSYSTPRGVQHMHMVHIATRLSIRLCPCDLHRRVQR
jgi:hypothetical protein